MPFARKTTWCYCVLFVCFFVISTKPFLGDCEIFDFLSSHKGNQERKTVCFLFPYSLKNQSNFSICLKWKECTHTSAERLMDQEGIRVTKKVHIFPQRPRASVNSAHWYSRLLCLTRSCIKCIRERHMRNPIFARTFYVPVWHMARHIMCLR